MRQIDRLLDRISSRLGSNRPTSIFLERSRGLQRVRIINTAMNQTGPSRYHHSTSSGSRDRYDLMPEPASPSLPRPSASLIVLDDRHRVLLVQRIKNATSFGGMHVSNCIVVYFEFEFDLLYNVI